MLSVLGYRRRMCDGLTRREAMRVGGLSLFGGLTMPRLLRAADAPAVRPGKAKSVVMFNCWASTRT